MRDSPSSTCVSSNRGCSPSDLSATEYIRICAFCRGPRSELADVSKIFSYVTTIPTGHVRQVIQTSEAQLASSPTATQSAQASCPAAFCRWRDEGAPGICGSVVSCEGVPSHFRNIHGIKNMEKSELVGCRWEGCFVEVTRKNFVRHVRGRHLDHTRDKGHSP